MKVRHIVRSGRPLEIAASAVACGLVFFGVLVQTRQQTTPNAGTCTNPGANHTILLQNDNFSPQKTTLNQCDTLTVVNRDDSAYLLAFGVHTKHYQYPGFLEQTVAPGQHVRIDMVKAGQFHLHDHYRNNANADITVAPRR